MDVIELCETNELTGEPVEEVLGYTFMISESSARELTDGNSGGRRAMLWDTGADGPRLQDPDPSRNGESNQVNDELTPRPERADGRTGCARIM